MINPECEMPSESRVPEFPSGGILCRFKKDDGTRVPNSPSHSLISAPSPAQLTLPPPSTLTNRTKMSKQIIGNDKYPLKPHNCGSAAGPGF